MKNLIKSFLQTMVDLWIIFIIIFPLTILIKYVLKGYMHKYIIEILCMVFIVFPFIYCYLKLKKLIIKKLKSD